MSETQDAMSVKRAKEQAKTRDEWECRFCGVSNEQHKREYDRGLHAHHIIKDNDGGADHPRNFITVCRECHNTLENTQADALSRIKEEHTSQVKELYERRIMALEADLRKERNKEYEVFGWLQDHSIEVHLLLEGPFRPSVKTFKDRDEAAEAYAESDESTKLISTKFSIGEMVEDSIRFSSANNVTLKFDSNAGSYLERGSKPQGYWSADVPDTIKEDSNGGA